MIRAHSLWELVERRANATPDALFGVDEADRCLSFAEFREQATRAAAGLASLGLGVGSTVSWALPTCLESMVLAAALARLGAVQNPILPVYRNREVGFVTAQAGSRLLCVPGQWRGFDHAAMARNLRTMSRMDVEVPATRQFQNGFPATLFRPTHQVVQRL